MRQYRDGEWVVFELVPDIIIAHAGIQAGGPTIKGTRVTTKPAGFSFGEQRWRDYHIKKEQAFAAMCFEAGREYQKRSTQKKIDQAVRDSWEEYYKANPVAYGEPLRDKS